MQELLDLATQYGIPIVLVIFFVWKDFKREERMNIRTEDLERRIEELEKEMRTILKDQVAKSTAVIMDNTNFGSVVR